MTATTIAAVGIVAAVAFLIYDAWFSAPDGGAAPDLTREDSPSAVIGRAEVFAELDRLRLFFEAAGLSDGADNIREAMHSLIDEHEPQE